jgi:hypothetical protein
MCERILRNLYSGRRSIERRVRGRRENRSKRSSEWAGFKGRFYGYGLYY